MHIKARITCFVIVCLFVASCSVNPVTGEKEFSLVSASQEVAIGQQNYQPSQQAQGGRYYIDPDLQFYVAQVGNKLAAVSDRPKLPYEFVVLNNSVPNAWALPGGKIAVNRGLLIHLQDESELAAVLGHEIVHAAARHSAQQMTRGTLLSAGGQILGAVASQSEYGAIANMGIQVGSAAWTARYGRSAELESDAYGMDYMVRAGYDPQGAVKLQQTFVKLNENRQTDFISGLFASHPPSQERVNANREKAKTLPRGTVNRDVYQRKIAQIKRDMPAYEAQEAAMKAINGKDPKTALAALDVAVKLQPAEGYSWELRGHAWKLLENYANADKAYSTAITKNPELFSHYLARGMLRYEQGSKLDAKADLERSQALLPTQTGSFLLGELAAQADNKQDALQYYQQAMQGGGKVAEAAQAKVAVMELGTAPHKYIASQAYVGNDGYLQVAVKNNAGITVNNVKVELVELTAGNVVRATQTLGAPGSLEAGKQVSIKTKLGPFDSKEAAASYRTRVVAAQP